MTKEEAIKSVLKYLVHKQQEQGSWGYADNNDNEISWNEVIRWVDQQPCGDLISRQSVIDTIETDCSWDIFNEWGSRTPTGECIINAIKSVPSVETESCGDCISRQAVLDLAESGKLVSNGNYKSVCDAINGLPSVEPKQKKGHWIMQNDRSKKLLGWLFCSECNAWIGEPTDYCSNCGADMREVDNE